MDLDRLGDKFRFKFVYEIFYSYNMKPRMVVSSKMLDLIHLFLKFKFSNITYLWRYLTFENAIKV